jgi:TATA-box binding protein (TBP) (component of TFIID and TFIIIB)
MSSETVLDDLKRYSINAATLVDSQKEIKRLTYFQITNLVVKVNPIVEGGIELNDLVEFCKAKGIECKYNSIKKSGLNLRDTTRNISYLAFKSGKISLIGLRLENDWRNVGQIEGLLEEDINKRIAERIDIEVNSFLNLLKDYPGLKKKEEITHEITNIVWDLVNIYQIDILKLAKENKTYVSFDPELFIAASYRPFKNDPNNYKGSFNIFGSRRSVYTGSKSVSQFKLAVSRLAKILKNYAKVPKESEYNEIIERELELKRIKREKRKNKIPGKRGRKPKNKV